MERVEDCISFLIGKAAQEVSRRSREKLKPHGVTPTQYAVLKLLWDADGQSGAEIGARLRLDSATVTGIVDRLEKSGLIRRKADGDDRRVHRLFLTPRGRKLEAPLDKAMDALNEEIADRLGPANASRFWKALRHIGKVEN